MSNKFHNEKPVCVVHITPAFDSNTTIVTDSANVQITVWKENNVLQETDQKVSKESKCSDLKESLRHLCSPPSSKGILLQMSILPQQNTEWPEEALADNVPTEAHSGLPKKITVRFGRPCKGKEGCSGISFHRETLSQTDVLLSHLLRKSLYLINDCE